MSLKILIKLANGKLFLLTDTRISASINTVAFSFMYQKSSIVKIRVSVAVKWCRIQVIELTWNDSESILYL